MFESVLEIVIYRSGLYLSSYIFRSLLPGPGDGVLSRGLIAFSVMLALVLFKGRYL
ncbi:hypothetical protein [endosymbiont of Ridgeia piscesae]|jgi:hypothetical protein|uniref:Uncharacterized protein n=1 Tax=endosymbiont of Ridgeia piscesae TaxID=54398 RepID=A0A0T5Z5W6_9GAMM|nr:hypothetical protein [endosymbiont of Ridgeia piscesae]KRT53720.1 hypothetical protein Ga0074115_10151 [endosymbiont of Ridgeia piscesae]KRT58099.1 hypothetical protein Ga0076813_12756 [endosymbiont of Ridgeia piscesae]